MHPSGVPGETRASCLERHASSPFFRAEVGAILSAVGLRPGVRAIDLGCGNGYLVAAASATGAFAVGLDRETETIRSARTLNASGAFLRGSVERLPFRTESVDAVVAQHVIEHLADPALAVAEWHRVLRAGGRLVVLTPNARYPDPGVFNDRTHVRIFDPPTLVALLRKRGFQVSKTATIFPYLRGHIAFGLRHRDLLSRIPPWASSGRSLICAAQKPLLGAPHG